MLFFQWVPHSLTILYILSHFTQQTCEMGSVIVPTVPLGKQKQEEVKYFAKGQPASENQSQPSGLRSTGSQLLAGPLSRAPGQAQEESVASNSRGP